MLQKQIKCLRRPCCTLLTTLRAAQLNAVGILETADYARIECYGAVFPVLIPDRRNREAAVEDVA